MFETFYESFSNWIFESCFKVQLWTILIPVFIFCYTLSMVLNLIEILHEELFRQPVGYLLNDVNNILVVINSSSSFIFYTKYSSRFAFSFSSNLSAPPILCVPVEVHTVKRHHYTSFASFPFPHFACMISPCWWLWVVFILFASS